MIGKISTKALKRLYEKDDGSGLPAGQVKKLRSILHLLDQATGPCDISLKALRLKPLQGSWDGYWQIDVNGNYRVRFRFEDGHVMDVHYRDWH